MEALTLISEESPIAGDTFFCKRIIPTLGSSLGAIRALRPRFNPTSRLGFLRLAVIPKHRPGRYPVLACLGMLRTFGADLRKLKYYLTYLKDVPSQRESWKKNFKIFEFIFFGSFPHLYWKIKIDSYKLIE